jgi:hypothetical protein
LRLKAPQGSSIRFRQPGFTEVVMDLQIAWQPIASLIAGILILIIPRLLNYIVALYLIISGILGLIR